MANEFFDVEDLIVVPEGTDVIEEAPPPIPPEGDPAPAPGAPGEEPPPGPGPGPGADWTSNLTVEDKRQLLEGWLAELPYEERVKLGPIADVDNRARQSAGAQARTQLERQTEAESREARAAEAFQTLSSRWQANQIPPSRIPEELESYRQVAADTQTQEHREQLWGVITTQMTRMGIDQIPPEVLTAARGERTLAGGVGHYLTFMLTRAFEVGQGAGQKGLEATTKADATANRERIKADYFAELKEKGLIRDDAPPTFGGRDGGGRVDVLSDEKLADIANWTEEEHTLYEPQVQALAKQLLMKGA
jgi:hypothetical protein